jgi:hypothetical protein
MNSAQRRYQRIKWFLAHIDFIFLIPFVLFLGLTTFGLTSPFVLSPYTFGFVVYTALIGATFMFEEAVRKKKLRTTRILILLIFTGYWVNSFVTYPGFRQVLS